MDTEPLFRFHFFVEYHTTGWLQFHNGQYQTEGFLKKSQLTHKSCMSMFTEANMNMIVKYTDDWVSLNTI